MTTDDPRPETNPQPRHTGLGGLCAIARYHGLALDERRLLHDYALGQEEAEPRLLAKMAQDNGLKASWRSLPWSKAILLGRAYPVLARKRNGSYFLLSGARPVQTETTVEAGPAGTAKPDEATWELAVIDFQKPLPTGQGFHFWTKEQYEAETGGQGLFLKRTYRLDDENRPFGLAWFIPEFIKLKGLFGQIALAMLLITVVALLTPLYFQITIDKVLPNKSYNTLNVLGVGIAIAVLFNALLEFLRNWLLLFATNKIDINTASRTFAHMMRLPMDFFERLPSGILLKHMQQTEKIRGFLSGNLFFTVLDLVSLLVFIPFLLFYSVTLTLVVLGFSFLMALVVVALIKPFQRRLNILYQAEGKRQSRLVESIHGIRTVKSLALEPVEEKDWNNATAFSILSYFSVGKISMTAKTLSQMLEMFMVVAIVWVGAHLVFDRDISIGALIAFQMLSGRVSGPLVKLVSLVHEYQQIALSVKMLGVVMNHPPEPAGGGVRNSIRGEIVFENISFQYQPDMPQVITDFSLHIPAGGTIGIVGRSGSGKSTLSKLLQGMYPLQRGLIKIDDIDLREIDKVHLRRNIGIVLQENFFFQGSIRDNISVTRRDASPAEIIDAARLAGAHDFIQEMPRGYDTFLEENASNLSGGQKQRLAIARTLLAKPPILIFDEATSALDPESEHIVQQNLEKIASGRTVLIISHRLSIVSKAQKILVLDKGQRLDYATHAELIERPGLYRDFWRQQMGIEP